MLQDLELAARQFRKSPAFTALASLTLALGIGGTTAIFSALYAVVLRPLPFPDSDRLIDVATAWQGGAGAISTGNFALIQREARAFSAVAARESATYNLTENGEPERILGARVSHQYFEVLGLAPSVGRVFDAAEDAPGHERVVVLSQRLWSRRYGSDRELVGKQIRLSGVVHDVIGVMPKAFELPGADVEVWTPIAFSPKHRENFDAHYLTVIGRLRPGVTKPQLDDDARALAAAMVRAAPRDNEGRALLATPILERIVGDTRQRLLLLLGAVALVLLIACTNVAGLLLARGASRAREISVRAALGATRSRIVRQLLTEALLLSGIGAAAGLLVAFAFLRFFVAQAPAGVPRLAEASLDATAFVVAIAAALLATVIAGLAPALRASRTNAAEALGATRGAVGVVRDPLRQGFIAAEVALALMLLMGAGLLVRSGRNLDRVSPGFDAEGVLSARLALPAASYPGEERPARAFGQMVERLKSAPGVADAAASSRPPLIGDVTYGLLPEGWPNEPKSRINSRLQLVTPGYLDMMRIPLRQGRSLTSDDRGGQTRVAIVNETLARRAWPGQNPIGKRFACCEGSDAEPSWKEVVGVVADTRARGLGAADATELYIPIDQSPARGFDAIGRSVTLLARSKDGRPETLVSAIRAAVRDEDPSLPLYDVALMTTRLRSSTAAAGFNAMLLGTLSGVGLLLAAVGLYGVIAYLVSLRTREIGVRMALGARPRDVMALVMGQGLRSVLLGLGLGTFGCFAQAQAFERLLFGISGRDPATFAVVAALLVAIALVASALPARRAARIEPIAALAEG